MRQHERMVQARRACLSLYGWDPVADVCGRGVNVWNVEE
jgi:hypothetical protein